MVAGTGEATAGGGIDNAKLRLGVAGMTAAARNAVMSQAVV
jgi:hypothetical protein